ncbi:hypothetical protein FRC08_014466 [Ceratobasidium sp. 394]|nr:hypothetical protein FRC08_014466 [Ceratobasidium sp. 394]
MECSGEGSGTNGQPENLSELLPSDCTAAHISASPHRHAIHTKLELRRVNCLKNLQLVRGFCAQKAHLFKAQEKHARGISAMTRAAALQACVKERLDHAQSSYNNSRDRLDRLGATSADLAIFQVLTSSDINSLASSLGKVRSLGEGRVQMPWYWRVVLPSTSEHCDVVYSSKQDIQAEYNNSLKVEWFRGREQYCRWKEEVCWLQREAALVVFSFDARAKGWAD